MVQLLPEHGIGNSGNYAIAKIKGLPQFKNNESDKLIVFKQKEGQ